MYLLIDNANHCITSYIVTVCCYIMKYDAYMLLNGNLNMRFLLYMEILLHTHGVNSILDSIVPHVES